MSLDLRRVDHVRDVAYPEPVSPLESPDDASARRHSYSRHEDVLSHTLSPVSFTTLQDSQNINEIGAPPASPVRCLSEHHYISTGHSLSPNLQRPLPIIPYNPDISCPISESCEPVGSKTIPNSVSSSRSHRSLTSWWWWWWEILAMTLSMASMSLLAFLLSKINGTPLETWNLPIEPHTLIAILTTTGKTALLVPAASCISQLKWRHFTEKPRKLINFQIFDDASRGPWGSILLVWHMTFRARLLVAPGFALVTVLVLGIDPSAQQILKFPVRESPLRNVSVVLGTADMYYSKGFLENTDASEGTWQANSDLLALQSSIVNGVTGSVFQPYFNCPGPASRCTWDIFITLGVCAEFKDVSRDAVAHCSDSGSPSMNCTYSIPGIDDGDDKSDGMVMQWDTESMGGAGPSTMLFQSQFSPTNEDTGSSHIGSFLAVKALGDGYPLIESNATGGLGWAPPPTEVYYATFGWCAKKFQNVSASQKRLNVAPITSEGLTWANAVGIEEEGNLMGTSYFTYRGDVSGATFNVSKMALQYLPIYLSTLLTTTVYHNIYRPDNGPADNPLAFGFALMNSNLSHVVPDLADTLTNQLRSNNPGDNYNATTTTGKAFFDEPYIEVRWVYLTLPFSVTLFAAILLAMTIIITDKQPLLKQSSVALLVNRLQGWKDEELNVDEPQTQQKLDRLAETMVARLEVDQNGTMRLVRKSFD